MLKASFLVSITKAIHGDKTLKTKSHGQSLEIERKMNKTVNWVLNLNK